MAEYKDREHFIPIRQAELVDLLCRYKGLSAAEQDQVRELAKLLEATFHFEYHQRLEGLKAAYAPFDPDADTKPLREPTADEKQRQMGALFDNFTSLLERANFKQLTMAEIQAALEGASDWGINMDVDFGVFERLAVYVRGDTVGKRSRRKWQNLWRMEEASVPIYQRLVLIMKLKKHRRLGDDVDTDDVYLKIFKDIPKMDLEMLLPGAKVQLSRLDFGLIVYPLIAGVMLMVYHIARDVIEAWHPDTSDPAKTAKEVAVLGGLLAAGLWKLGSWATAGALGGYGYKSYYSYNIKKQAYTLQLTKSLYYQTLDSNAGVLFRLLDEAEEQENREALLAYFFLWRKAGDQGWTPEQLDDYVEMYLEGETKLKVDFEIGDALDKLKRLKIVDVLPDGRIRALPMAKALEALDYAWDNVFKYNKN
jgi:hypothetical protein